MLSVQLWYLLGIVSLVAFICILAYYIKYKLWTGVLILIGIVCLFVGVDYIVEYGGVTGTEWGYPASMLHIYGVPIEMIFISMGAGAIVGFIIWKGWKEQGKPMSWSGALLAAFSIFGFVMSLVFKIAPSFPWFFLPAAIWGTFQIMRYRPRMMLYAILTGIAAMITDIVLEWYYTIYTSTYWYVGMYDLWWVAPCYYCMAIFAWGIGVYIIANYGKTGSGGE